MGLSSQSVNSETGCRGSMAPGLAQELLPVRLAYYESSLRGSRCHHTNGGFCRCLSGANTLEEILDAAPERQGAGTLDEMLFNSPAGSGAPRADPELVVEGDHVGIDRAGANDQGFGDLRVRQPLGEQTQNLMFTGGQVG
jgi:hypothetical protein